MKKYALIGSNIQHSLSPTMHKYYYDLLNISADYELIDIKNGLNAEKISELEQMGLDGFNVTMPFKTAIIPYLDKLSDASAKIGSVNTIICKDGHWIGDNTDYLGFKTALAIDNVDLNGKTILLLGAGGAARAVVHALIEIGVKSILIYARSREKTNQLMLEVRRQYQFKQVMSVYDTHGLVVDCVINATPLGNMNFVNDLSVDLKEMQLSDYIDLNYLPEETLTMASARSLSLNAFGGVTMLAAQAFYSLQAWQDLTFSQADSMRIIAGASDVCFPQSK